MNTQRWSCPQTGVWLMRLNLTIFFSIQNTKDFTNCLHMLLFALFTFFFFCAVAWIKLGWTLTVASGYWTLASEAQSAWIGCWMHFDKIFQWWQKKKEEHKNGAKLYESCSRFTNTACSNMCGLGSAHHCVIVFVHSHQHQTTCPSCVSPVEPQVFIMITYTDTEIHFIFFHLLTMHSVSVHFRFNINR